MGTMSKFQIVVIGAFTLLIIISVIIFAGYKGRGSQQVEVVIWGTLPSADFARVVEGTSLYQSNTLKLTYVEKDASVFDEVFVEALAAGAGPDLFFLPHDKIVKQKNKIFIIPYDSFSERQFKNSFIEGSEIFLDSDGVIALPFIVDPLVMYWNRNIFTDAKVTVPPKHWDEFYSLSSTISKKDGALNINQSLVPFGEYRNVTNAKEILSTLMMQAGTPIVDRSVSPPRSALAQSFGRPIVPSEAAVNFYTEFSNPIKPFYSWNRSMPPSSTYFLSGDLAIYFGFASEIFDIQKKNPNLNFDVAPVPTSREGGVNTSFAKFYGLSLTRSSPRHGSALAAAMILTSAQGAASISEVLSLPPVRRDLLARRPTDAYKSVFYDSAIRGRAWLDPDPSASAEIFAVMIDSITSGRERTSSAVSKANNAFNLLFR